MDHLQRFIAQFRSRLFIMLLIDNAIIFGDWWIVEHVLKLSDLNLAISLLVCAVVATAVLPWVSAHYLTQPTKLIWQAILHIAPDTVNVPAPNLKRPGLGHDLVMNLVSHVYQLASVVDNVEKTAASKRPDLHADFVANSMPLPLVVLDKDQNILFANKAMCDYLERGENEIAGQNVYSMLDLSFPSEETLDKWLASAKQNAAVDSKTWERVRLNILGGAKTKQFDLGAYYNRSNPQGFETMLVLFDHPSYSQDDQALGFVALAVHELRTPITLLKGYIEALEEDLHGKLSAEDAAFMHKMKAQAESLTAFINNMLNVARIENDQLVLKLQESKWPEIVQTAVDDLSLRARIQGVELTVQVGPGIPVVGVDRVGIYEVLVNLMDNAIKYSGKSAGKKVIVKTYLNKEGMVETTVQDFGAGIPASILPNLFEKFYRSHRSRNQVGGTGLGLYLSKSIIDAHGGRIWVNSKEGEGSTFGFTVVPYAKLAEEKKNGDNNDISRGAHGWIKNHSLYSR